MMSIALLILLQLTAAEAPPKTTTEEPATQAVAESAKRLHEVEASVIVQGAVRSSPQQLQVAGNFAQGSSAARWLIPKLFISKPSAPDK